MYKPSCKSVAYQEGVQEVLNKNRGGKKKITQKNCKVDERYQQIKAMKKPKCEKGD